MTLVQFVIP